MKKGIILSVFTLVLVLTLGCERDAVLPKLNISASDHLRTISISGDMDVSISSQVNVTRGFPMTPNRDPSGKKTTNIDFVNGDWDNGAEKPTLLLVTGYPEFSSFHVVWAKALGKNEYTYTKADGSNNPRIKFNTDIKYDPDHKKQSILYVFALDRHLNYTCELSSGRIYNVNFSFPSLIKRGYHAYILKPLAESNIRLIFQAAAYIPSLVYNKGHISLDMKPFGTLILFDIENVSDEEYTIEDNYQLLIKTAGFSFEDVNFSLSKYAATHTPAFDGARFDKTVYGYKLVNDKPVVDKSNILSGVSMDYTKILLEKPKGKDKVVLSAKGSGETSRSVVYGLYVLKNDFEPNRPEGDIRNYRGLSIYHMYSGTGSSNSMGDLIFDLKYGFNFYNCYSKTLSMTLTVPAGNGLFDFGTGSDLDKYTDPWGIIHAFDESSDLENQEDNNPEIKLRDFDDSSDDIKNDTDSYPESKLHDFSDDGKKIKNQEGKNPKSRLDGFSKGDPIRNF